MANRFTSKQTTKQSTSYTMKSRVNGGDHGPELGSVHSMCEAKVGIFFSHCRGEAASFAIVILLIMED
jgi:hypothetical protein